MQLPVMHVFRKHDGKIFHFWGTEVGGIMSTRFGPIGISWTLRRRGGQTFPLRRKSSGPNSWKKTI